MVALGTDPAGRHDEARDEPDPGGPVARTTSDFLLVESSDGWTLTINLNVDLLAALAATEASAAPAAVVPFAVHIVPNLVPGEPFLAKVIVKRPAES